MAKKHDPWWTKGDSAFGGETFECQKTESQLEVRKGDVFRIEKRGKAVLLTPHPDNTGPWNKVHTISNPIKLTKRPRPRPSTKRPKNKRVFSMDVTLNGQVQTFFLAERNNGEIVIAFKDPDAPGAELGAASIRR